MYLFTALIKNVYCFVCTFILELFYTKIESTVLTQNKLITVGGLYIVVKNETGKKLWLIYYGLINDQLKN